jgi:hypothetical protein
MDQQLQNQLFEKYPDLFSNKDKDIMSSCMRWGCDCGNGWYDIISSVCWMIKQHEDNKRWQIKWKEKKNQEIKDSMGISIEGEEPEYFPAKFDQVKEKYGGLRMYFSGGDDYVDGLVSMAEAMSYKICEICGNKGECNKSGWFTTLCEGCRKS